MDGTFIFGFWDQVTSKAVELNPTYGSFLLHTKKFNDETKNFEILKEIEMTNVSRETH